MVKEKSFDFGRVAIGSDSVHRFTVKNIYEQDVRLLDIRSSCGCTDPSLSKKVIKSGETAEIIAKFNTSGQITREKHATLTADFETVVDGQVLRDAVQVQVSGYIRPDVVLTPGIVEFGSTAEGKSVVRTVMLDYAGKNDWALTKVERNNTFVHARAEEVKRQNGEVSYKITVTLKPNAPVGYVRDALRFITNEVVPGAAEPSEISLPIQGYVMSPIHAKPSPFMVGIVSAGDSVSKTIVVRSDSPFKILGVSSRDTRFRFTYADQESPIQIVAVLFTARRGEPGPVDEKIIIKTNLPDQEFVTLQAHGLLVPKEKVQSPPPATTQTSWKTVSDDPHFGPNSPGRASTSTRTEFESSPSPKNSAPGLSYIEASFSSQTPLIETDSTPIRSNSGGARFGRPKSIPDTADEDEPNSAAFVSEPPKKVAFRTPSLPDRNDVDTADKQAVQR